MKIKTLNKKQKGMTLIEITLVIAILLGLISVLFIGIRAYKVGSDNAKCILTLATYQKLAISYGNLNELNPADPAAITTLATEGYISDTAPACPSDGTSYTLLDLVPDSTVQYLTCTASGNGATQSYAVVNNRIIKKHQILPTVAP